MLIIRDYRVIVTRTSAGDIPKAARRIAFELNEFDLSLKRYFFRCFILEFTARRRLVYLL